MAVDSKSTSGLEWIGTITTNNVLLAVALDFRATNAMCNLAGKLDSSVPTESHKTNLNILRVMCFSLYVFYTYK